MAATKKTRDGIPMMTAAQQEFYAGAGSLPETSRRKSALAAAESAERERDEARAAAAGAVEASKKANLASNVAVALAGGGFDAVQIRRAQNLVQTERERCAKANEIFDYGIALATARHVVQQRAGKESLAPPGRAPIYPSESAKPTTWQELQDERQRFRDKLRELGLNDPEFGSIVGGGQ